MAREQDADDNRINYCHKRRYRGVRGAPAPHFLLLLVFRCQQCNRHFHSQILILTLVILCKPTSELPLQRLMGPIVYSGGTTHFFRRNASEIGPTHI